MLVWASSAMGWWPVLVGKHFSHVGQGAGQSRAPPHPGLQNINITEIPLLLETLLSKTLARLLYSHAPLFLCRDHSTRMLRIPEAVQRGLIHPRRTGCLITLELSAWRSGEPSTCRAATTGKGAICAPLVSKGQKVGASTIKITLFL